MAHDSPSAQETATTHSVPDSPVQGLPGFLHRYALVNGTQIHYVIGGEGPAIVLLHGWPYTWAVWSRLMPLLTAAGYTTIAPDLRGLGDSRLEELGFSKHNVAEDVRQIVLSLGFEKIDLLGMDIGTMVAYAYAAGHAEEIDHLVLTESLIPGFGLEDRMNPATGGYWHFGFHMQVEVATMLTVGKEAAYLLPTMSMMSTSHDAAEIASTTFLPKYVSPGRMKAGFQHYGTLLQDGRDNRDAFKSKLQMPVLVLNGERGIPQSQTLESVGQVAENVQAEIVPESGHLFGYDNPVWVAERLIRFFNSAR
jgi:pimeloyl-ACP methyl ester carboxylesterase